MKIEVAICILETHKICFEYQLWTNTLVVIWSIYVGGVAYRKDRSSEGPKKS